MAQANWIINKASNDLNDDIASLNELTDNNDHVGHPVDQSPESNQSDDQDIVDGTNVTGTETSSVFEAGGTIASFDSRSIASTHDFNIFNPLWVGSSYRNSRSDSESIHSSNNVTRL